jgi:hypothetical protein
VPSARTLYLGAEAQELPLHRIHLGEICRNIVVTAAFAREMAIGTISSYDT